jgi:hypothetical protein
VDILLRRLGDDIRTNAGRSAQSAAQAVMFYINDVELCWDVLRLFPIKQV